MGNTIYIIGAGAVGKALAVFLQRQGKSVILVRGSVDQLEEQQQRVTIAVKGQEGLIEDLVVSSIDAVSRFEGTVVLANKSYGNEVLASRLKSKIGQSPLVVMQNGLGVERPFIEQGFPEVYRCILFLASQTISDQEVSYKPVATSPIGVVKGELARVEEIVKLLDNPYMPFKTEQAIQDVIWEKAILNTVFNSICPLLDIDNGIFHRDSEVMQLASKVITECRAVAREQGVSLSQQQLEEKALMISKMSDGQLISTLQDIQNGRRTEIDTLNLEIARLASNAESIATTRLLGELTQLKSQMTAE